MLKEHDGEEAVGQLDRHANKQTNNKQADLETYRQTGTNTEKRHRQTHT